MRRRENLSKKRRKTRPSAGGTRGAATVFLCIVLAALMFVSGIAVDLIRWRIATARVEEAVRLTAESLLARQNRAFREEYGLFALGGSDAEYQAEAAALLLDNLMQPAGSAGVDPFGFTVRTVETHLLFNLSEPAILRQQIAEFMKLRAPAAMIRGFAAMLPAFAASTADASVIEGSMELERLLADARESMVRLHVLTTSFLPAINRTKRDSDLKKTVLAQMKNSGAEAANSLRDYLTMGGDADLESRYRKWSESAQLLEQIETRVEAADEALREAKAELREAEKDPSRSLELDGLKAERARLATRLDELRASLEAQRRVAEEAKDKVETVVGEKSRLLRAAHLSLADSLMKSLRLTGHLDVHAAYAQAAKELCGTTAERLDAVADERARIEAELGTLEDAVCESIRTKLRELENSASAATYRAMAPDFERMLQRLKEWTTAIGAYNGAINVDIDWIGAEQERLDGWLSLDRVPERLGEVTALHAESAMANLGEALSSLRAISEMGSSYPVPEPALDPAPSETETRLADSWIRTAYGSADEEAAVDASDRSGLSEIREGMSLLADEAAALFRPVSGASATASVVDDFAAAALPSTAGPVSSEAVLREIGEAGVVWLEGEEDAFSFSGMRLDGTAVDERRHGLFSEIFDRVREMASMLSRVAADGLDGMLESLYVDEYVVSAFKCAATGTEDIENGIGWGRNLDRTFFRTGEVEYVLFGSRDEAANLMLAKGSVWCVRLALNLVHIHQSPSKQAFLLEASTIAAGWMPLGIPLVRNLLMIGWSAAESMLDVERLASGETVPLMKTDASWQLDFRRFTLDRLRGALVDEAEDWVGERVSAGVDAVENGIRDSLQSWVDAAVDKAFEGISAGWLEASEHIPDPDVDLTGLLSSIASAPETPDMQTLCNWLESQVGDWINGISGRVRGMGDAALEGLKIRMKSEIMNALLGSPAYQGLMRALRMTSEQVVEKAFDRFAGEASNGSANMVGSVSARVFQTSYQDYMRLLLLLVPENAQLLRISDLMQLNMNALTGEDVRMSGMRTAVHVRAEVEMKCWFAGWMLGRRDGRLVIRAEWGQSY